MSSQVLVFVMKNGNGTILAMPRDLLFVEISSLIQMNEKQSIGTLHAPIQTKLFDKRIACELIVDDFYGIDYECDIDESDKLVYNTFEKRKNCVASGLSTNNQSIYGTAVMIAKNKDGNLINITHSKKFAQWKKKTFKTPK